MGRLYMVSGWEGLERGERLVVVVTAGKGSAGTVREEKEKRKKRAETAKPPRMAPKIPTKTGFVDSAGQHGAISPAVGDRGRRRRRGQLAVGAGAPAGPTGRWVLDC